jgi:xylan 1,4-beta-xylosidase
MSARNRPDAPLQRAGHADIVETQNGETYMVYLCGRPLKNRGRCVLGRETAIQKMVWGEDGWLRSASGDAIPELETPAPNLPEHKLPETPKRAEFDSPDLPIDFQWLRAPFTDELFSLKDRPGHLRLYGRESVGSLFFQSLVARRWQAFHFSAETVIEFEPAHYQQMAGLILYYDQSKFHYLYVSNDHDNGKHLRVMSALPDSPVGDAFSAPITIPAGKPVRLRCEVDEERLLFAYAIGDEDWRVLPQHFDASILSDEATMPGAPNFTGAFVGMACHDMSGAGLHADFDYFEYAERDYAKDPFAK